MARNFLGAEPPTPLDPQGQCDPHPAALPGALAPAQLRGAVPDSHSEEPCETEPSLAAQHRCSRTAASPGLLERGISAPGQGELMVLQLHPTSAVLCVLLRHLRPAGAQTGRLLGKMRGEEIENNNRTREVSYREESGRARP